jgi:FkbM family methyltransferase
MLKRAVRETLGRVGLQLQRTDGQLGLQLRRLPHIELENPYELWKRQMGWLTEFNLATVLDIGANTGQFASCISRLLPTAKIYSFEPLPDCFEQLQINMANAENFKAFNVALADRTGVLDFERNEFSPSSSFLKMADLHRDAFPYTSNSNTITVTTQRLDDFLEGCAIAQPMLVKIDVQGYEDKVLRGGEKTIRESALIILETSFETLYEGQPMFHEIYQRLVSWGFVYSGATSQLCSPQDGKPLQEDSIFVRKHVGAR